MCHINMEDKQGPFGENIKLFLEFISYLKTSLKTYYFVDDFR